jgi:dTDP-4-dehydrorhamnose 3,5-epimerase
VKLNSKAESAYRVQGYGKSARIEGLESIELKRHADEGGWMTELLRPGGEPGPGLDGFRLAQVNYSLLQPGVVKAFHVHRAQTDVWFVPPEDRVLMIAIDVRADSATEGNVVRELLGGGKTGLVRIPPGVAHGARNIGQNPARMIYFTDVEFSADPAECDEGRLPWDFAGRDAWEIHWD